MIGRYRESAKAAGAGFSDGRVASVTGQVSAIGASRRAGHYGIARMLANESKRFFGCENERPDDTVRKRSESAGQQPRAPITSTPGILAQMLRIMDKDVDRTLSRGKLSADPVAAKEMKKRTPQHRAAASSTYRTVKTQETHPHPISCHCVDRQSRVSPCPRCCGLPPSSHWGG